MNKYDMTDYRAAGCVFYKISKPAFELVWFGTYGKVCETGCSWFAGGKCPAYRKLTTVRLAAQQEPQETVRETAKRLGISISEVRRRRKQALAP